MVCRDGDIRLSGGPSVYEGKVEVCYDEEWRMVCGEGWSQQDALVTCRQLGYSTEGKSFHVYAYFFHKSNVPAFCTHIPYIGAMAISGSLNTSGSPPSAWINTTCRGNESQITQCSISGVLASRNCTAAGVRCYPKCKVSSYGGL